VLSKAIEPAVPKPPLTADQLHTYATLQRQEIELAQSIWPECIRGILKPHAFPFFVFLHWLVRFDRSRSLPVCLCVCNRCRWIVGSLLPRRVLATVRPMSLSPESIALLEVHGEQSTPLCRSCSLDHSSRADERFASIIAAELMLVFLLPTRYPEETLRSEVRWSGLQKGLFELQHAVLQSLLDARARELRGTPAMPELIGLATRWLDTVCGKKARHLCLHP
jgi:hypothetical protein